MSPITRPSMKDAGVRSLWRGAALCGAFVVFVACGPDVPTPPPSPTPQPPVSVVASVAVSPASASVTVGATVALAATVRDASGNEVAGKTAQWTSGNVAVATVSSSGNVTGLSAGTVTITAAVDGKSGAATVVVSAVVPVIGATVQFAPSVDATIRASIVAFVGVGDSISAAGPGKIATGNIALSPVVALNAAGDALLAGVVAPNGTTALDASSTAQMLVRLLLPIRLLEALPIATLNQAISTNADFAALSDSITVIARRGQSFALSAPAIAMGGRIATAVATALQPPRDPVADVAPPAAAAGESVASFSRYNVVVINGAGPASPFPDGGTVTFRNASFVPFSVKSSTETRRAIVTGSGLCALCWPPGYTPGDGTVRVSADGLFTLTVQIDKELVIGQLVIDFANTLMTAIGIKFPNDAKTVTEVYAEVNKSGVLTDLFAGKQPYSAVVSAATNAAISSAPALFDIALDRGLVRRNIFSGVTKMLLSVLVRADQFVALLKAPITTAEAVRYWDAEPEVTNACFEKFKLYGGCADSVSILTRGAEVGTIGGSINLLANVYDDKRRLMVGRTPDWFSSSTGIATITQATGLLKTLDNGAVIATARAGTRQDTATVLSAITGEYTLLEVNGIKLPGETYRDSLYITTTSSGSLFLGTNGGFSYSVAAQGANTRNTQTFNEGSAGAGTYKVTGGSLRLVLTQKTGQIDSLYGANVSKGQLTSSADGASLLFRKK
jgi:hypothetical protein